MKRSTLELAVGIVGALLDGVRAAKGLPPIFTVAIAPGRRGGRRRRRSRRRAGSGSVQAHQARRPRVLVVDAVKPSALGGGR